MFYNNDRQNAPPRNSTTTTKEELGRDIFSKYEEYSRAA